MTATEGKLTTQIRAVTISWPVQAEFLFKVLHKHHIISIQHPSHKCFPEKSCLDCLRILIISWLFKNPVVIMKKIMPCLFKDTINSGLAQFDHAQSNSKNGLKAKRERSNCHKLIFFLEKQLIKLSCTY